LTAVTGKWSQDFANRLLNAGLSCKILNKHDWEIAMYEKLIWISAFMIVGASHGGCTVGEVETKYNEEVCSIINELSNSVSTEKGIKFPSLLKERLCAYSRSVAHFPAGIKEFKVIKYQTIYLYNNFYSM
jgi:hypothetical protein